MRYVDKLNVLREYSIEVSATIRSISTNEDTSPPKITLGWNVAFTSEHCRFAIPFETPFDPQRCVTPEGDHEGTIFASPTVGTPIDPDDFSSVPDAILNGALFPLPPAPHELISLIANDENTAHLFWSLLPPDVSLKTLREDPRTSYAGKDPPDYFTLFYSLFNENDVDLMKYHEEISVER